MKNKKKSYKITLIESDTVPQKTVTFAFENHHNIIEMIEKTKDAAWFENKENNAQFILGVRLFADVMIQEHKNPLFTELLPSFKKFMKKLKSS